MQLAQNKRKRTGLRHSRRSLGNYVMDGLCPRQRRSNGLQLSPDVLFWALARAPEETELCEGMRPYAIDVNIISRYK